MIDKNIPYNLTPINPIEEFTEVKSSAIHGLGLFAKKIIPKGTIWWYARKEDLLMISREQFNVLESSVKTAMMENFMEILMIYSYYERDFDALVFCLDNSRYVNHSFNPNSGSLEDENPLCSVALRDIQTGEEITEDYSKYTFCDWLENYREYFDPICW